MEGFKNDERQRCQVLGSRVDALDWKQALDTAVDWSRRHESRYVCHANVHSIMSAVQDPRFRQILNDADMVTPDGMPLAWALRRHGFRGQRRLSGPDFMWRFCARAERLGLRIFLYGGKRETLERLERQLRAAFPSLRIAGAYAPPFRVLTPAEQHAINAHINKSGAHAVFVSLGCPKQERWMASQRDAIRAVMFGVGAAFEFHAGSVKRAPDWMRRRGLEWLHRLAQDPRRLWRRYLVGNSLFVLLFSWELLRAPRRGKPEVKS